jgi:hypothetical protein
MIKHQQPSENLLDEFFKEIQSDELKIHINSFIVKPILAMIYNELFPYICFISGVLISSIFLLLFVVCLLVFSH